ncbi:hypothetical protein F5Y14DRAFT_188717 [Nemania sp. NC0429]|nr:hypothetical protein F5Y14DRAFT_188717 [Nemania sp. NC0429]
MSATPQSHHAQEEELDLVERYFDLENASSPSDEHSTPASGEDPITNDKPTPSSGEAAVAGLNMIETAFIEEQDEDPVAEQFFMDQAEQYFTALRQAQEPGERGPFVFPHSPDVFMGAEAIFKEQVTKMTEEAVPEQPMPAKPLTPPMPAKPLMPPMPLVPLMLENGGQMVSKMIPMPNLPMPPADQESLAAANIYPGVNEQGQPQYYCAEEEAHWMNLSYSINARSIPLGSY